MHLEALPLRWQIGHRNSLGIAEFICLLRRTKAACLPAPGPPLPAAWIRTMSEQLQACHGTSRSYTGTEAVSVIPRNQIDCNNACRKMSLTSWQLNCETRNSLHFRDYSLFFVFDHNPNARFIQLLPKLNQNDELSSLMSCPGTIAPH